MKLLVDEAATTGDKSTADNVRKLFAEIKKSATKDDFVFVVLFGHGTYDGDVAKFNLVGPDLTAKDWTDLFNGIQGTWRSSTPPKRASRFSTPSQPRAAS